MSHTETCKARSEAKHPQPHRHHSLSGLGSSSGSWGSARVRVGVLVRASSSRRTRTQFWCPCCSARSTGRSPSYMGAVSRGRPLTSLSSSLPSSFPPSGFALLQTALGPPPGRAARGPLPGSAAAPGRGDSPRQRPRAAASAPRPIWGRRGGGVSGGGNSISAPILPPPARCLGSQHPHFRPSA